MLNYELLTPYADMFDKYSPLAEYPRPTLVRSSYINLNGIWKCAITNSKNIPTEFNDDIVVPYVVESYLSGIRRDLLNEFIWYKKEIFITPEMLKNDHIILHFDGVFQICDIYFNDKKIIHHEGGFTPFSVDVKDLIKEKNTIIVFVENKPDYNLGVGKEGKTRGGMWYTKTTGIWKTVWLEGYSDLAIYDITINTFIDGKIIGNIESNDNNFNLKILFNNEVIYEKNVSNSFVIKLDNPKLWDIESPNLYYIYIESKNDKIESYFAFREFVINGNKFYLNNKEIFINGLLDQGYYSDGIYTPASYDGYKDDILKMKALGFNALRKHIKLEPDYFYYLADKLGMLVLQDLPNSGKYSFFIDTALPTIGFKKIFGKNKASWKRKEHFLRTGEEIINIIKKHPSVVYITLFNEGWGQFKADNIYDYFKDYYPNIIYDTTSGWFYKKKSDVLSIHNYFKKLKCPKSNKPVIISEFGGYNLRIDEHIFNKISDYGYHKVSNTDTLSNDLNILFNKIRELKKEGLAGAIYTQLSDVEDETNGLLTYDRKIAKIEKNNFFKI